VPSQAQQRPPVDVRRAAYQAGRTKKTQRCRRPGTRDSRCRVGGSGWSREPAPAYLKTRTVAAVRFFSASHTGRRVFSTPRCSSHRLTATHWTGRRMLARRSAIRQQLVLLEQRLGVGDAATLSQLRSELRAYWVSMDPILSWSPQEKAALSQVFLRRQVLARRLTRDI
jgi:hypothetical protein